MPTTEIPGKNTNRKVMIYTISTCGWCKKTKELLKALDVAYEYVDIDVLTGEERNTVREELKRYNPNISCPTIVIDNGAQVIIGFREEEIKKVCEK